MVLQGERTLKTEYQSQRARDREARWCNVMWGCRCIRKREGTLDVEDWCLNVETSLDNLSRPLTRL